MVRFCYGFAFYFLVEIGSMTYSVGLQHKNAKACNINKITGNFVSVIVTIIKSCINASLASQG